MRSSWRFLFLVLALGCGGETAPEHQPAEPPPVAAPTSDSEAATERVDPPAPTLNARVFVDVSGSMRGFVGRGRRVISSVHQAIDDSLSAAHRAAPTRCLVGPELVCDRVPSTNIEYDQPSLYTAHLARLDHVLRRAPRPDRVDPDHPPATDALDDVHVTVLVTDGMQVAGHLEAGAPGNTGESLCQAGADPNCIAALLQARVREGFGIWVVHQYLAFDGPHFAERPLDPSHMAQVEAHAQEVTLDPRYNGVEFRVGRVSTDTRTGTSSFPYRGVKPLMIVVLSRDVELGRAVVSGTVERLRSQPLQPGRMAPAFVTQSVELAPLSPSRFRFGTLEAAPRDDQSGIPTEEQREVRIRSSERSEDGSLAVSVWCGARGRQLWRLGYATERPSVSLPSFVDERVALNGPVGRVPERVAAPAVTRADSFRIGLNCQALNAATVSFGYELVAELTLDASRASEEWWHELSAMDSYRSPEHAYGLRELALRVLEESATRRISHGRVRIHVEREGEQ